MGGNALKFYQTRRVDKTEYLELVKLVQDKLLNCFNNSGLVIPCFRNKTDFGDLDLILDSSVLPENWLKILLKEFNIEKNTQWIKNGNVVSIGVNNFQVDLIITPHKYVLSSLNYFSYNDLGNLLGRIFHKLGIKFGHKGLSLIIRYNNSGHILKEIELTQDYNIILDILGLSYDKFLKGFDNIEDIYDFVCESKYFDKEIYLLNNRDHTSRVRDKKRTTYNNFLKYIQNKDIVSNYSFENKTEFGGYSIREPFYTEIVLRLFPSIKKEIDELISEFELKQQFKMVYNGEIVSKITGLTGKELGKFMSDIKFDINEIKMSLINPNHVTNKIERHLFYNNISINGISII